MNSPTTAWTAIGYPSTVPDFSNDQNTGQDEDDIIGNSTHPAFYIAFDDAGTLLLTDGVLGFRVRLGAETNPAGYGHSLVIGIDGDLDGALDVFALVDNTGADEIAIYEASGGANTSPGTTGITNTGTSYGETASNYDWSPVTVTIDPSATLFDLDADGNTDRFLSFAVPFQDLVNRLAAVGIAGVDQDTPIRYVIGTSTNGSSFNQDIGGPNDAIDSPSSWTTLGAMSLASAPAASLVPEPGTGLLLGFGLFGLAARRRR
jgi:hypothetical protein